MTTPTTYASHRPAARRRRPHERPERRREYAFRAGVRRNAVRLGSAETGTPEWHALRADLITGSRIGAIAGLSPWDSRYSTWARMAGFIGEPPETEAMRWGTLLEPLILDRVERDHGVKLWRDVGTWANRGTPWMGANPDALSHALGVVEAKAVGHPSDVWGPECRDLSEPANDRVPPHYAAQVTWYQHVLGVHRGALAALVSGSSLRYYTIEYDAELAARLVAVAAEFRDDLLAGVAPDIDEHGATYDAVREMHPDIDGDTVEIPADLARSLIRASRAAKLDAADVQECRATIADLMGNARYAECRGVRIADRRAKGNGTPYVQLAHKIETKEIPEDDE